jgi:hypothetical protein
MSPLRGTTYPHPPPPSLRAGPHQIPNLAHTASNPPPGKDLVHLSAHPRRRRRRRRRRRVIVTARLDKGRLAARHDGQLGPAHPHPRGLVVVVGR